MKKTLALVLALLMVLALVPTAFATTILTDDAEHKIEVTVRIDDADIDSIEICKANGWTHDHKALEWYKTFSATGKNPTVNVEVPYGMIDELPGTGIWDSDVLDVQVKVSGLYYSWNRFDYKDDKITVTLDGKDVTEDIDFGKAVSSDDAKKAYQEQIDTYNNQLKNIENVAKTLLKTLIVNTIVGKNMLSLCSKGTRIEKLMNMRNTKILLMRVTIQQMIITRSRRPSLWTMSN